MRVVRGVGGVSPREVSGAARLAAGMVLGSDILATIRHLRNAPITEAILDFRVSLPPDFRPEILHSARERLRTSYPHVDERKSFEALFAIMPERPAGTSTQTRDLGFQGLWLKTEDGKTVAQFRVDGFTFNRLKPYTSWEEISPEAMRLWQIYADIARPRSVTRLAVRYINRLPLPAARIELDDYIITAPIVPELIPDNIATFATRTVFAHPQRQLAANVVQLLELNPQDPTRPVLLFDIDVYRIGELQVDNEVLGGVLADLRLYKNQVFFGSLTENFIQSFA